MRERIVKIEKAFDKRNEDPKKDYGIHGVTMRFILKGPEGAVGFVLYTNWQLPHVREEFRLKMGTPDRPHLFQDPFPVDIGYHSKVPHYEGQLKCEDCEFTGGVCYYDGFSLQAEKVFDAMVKGGEDALWKELESYYTDWLLEKK